jgi:hypothetical protein
MDEEEIHEAVLAQNALAPIRAPVGPLRAGPRGRRTPPAGPALAGPPDRLAAARAAERENIRRGLDEFRMQDGYLGGEGFNAARAGEPMNPARNARWQHGYAEYGRQYERLDARYRRGENIRRVIGGIALGGLGLLRGYVAAAVGGVGGAVIGPVAVAGIGHFVIGLYGGRRALAIQQGGSMNTEHIHSVFTEILKDEVPNDKLGLANKTSVYLFSKASKYKLDITEDDIPLIKESIQTLESIDIKTNIQLLLYLGITKADIKNAASMAGNISILNNNSTRKNNSATKKNKTRTKN